MVLGEIVAKMGFGPINVSAMIDKIFFYIGWLLIFIVIGVGVGIAWKIKKRNKDIKMIKKIGWWEQGNNTMQPAHMDDAEEIIIPGTSLRVFYVAKRDLWLPRFNRGITTSLFYVLLTENRQMLNFTIDVPDSKGKSGLVFDHTDILWAAENTREFIKRNYKDKSVKWWQEYKEIIAVASLVVIMTISFVTIIWFLRGAIGDIGEVSAQLGNLWERTEAARQTSGVAPA